MDNKEKENIRESVFTKDEIHKGIKEIRAKILKPRLFDVTPDLKIANELRKQYQHTNGFTAKRTQRHVAKVPYIEYLMAIRRDPETFKNKRKFRRWISNHPQYRVVNNI
jgi:hypothetical protein